MEEKQVQLNLEPAVLAVANVNVNFSEEEFVLTIMSGNLVRRYLTSPKHMKRLSLLLQRELVKYEKQFGELKTSLPESKEASTEKRGIGF